MTDADSELYIQQAVVFIEDAIQVKNISAFIFPHLGICFYILID